MAATAKSTRAKGLARPGAELVLGVLVLLLLGLELPDVPEPPEPPDPPEPLPPEPLVVVVAVTDAVLVSPELVVVLERVGETKVPLRLVVPPVPVAPEAIIGMLDVVVVIVALSDDEMDETMDEILDDTDELTDDTDDMAEDTDELADELAEAEPPPETAIRPE